MSNNAFYIEDLGDGDGYVLYVEECDWAMSTDYGRETMNKKFSLEELKALEAEIHAIVGKEEMLRVHKEILKEIESMSPEALRVLHESHRLGDIAQALRELNYEASCATRTD